MRDLSAPILRTMAFSLVTLLSACGGSDEDVDHEQAQPVPLPIVAPPTCPSSGVCR